MTLIIMALIVVVFIDDDADGDGDGDGDGSGGTLTHRIHTRRRRQWACNNRPLYRCGEGCHTQACAHLLEVRWGCVSTCMPAYDYDGKIAS